MTRFHTRRGGFTLIELLAVMALMATLAAIAMVVAPGIMEKDRSVDATTQLELWLQISRARAQRDKAPRGIRLIVDTSKPINEQLWVTEAQPIESPPVLVFNQDPPYPGGVASPLNPHVELRYAAEPLGANGGRINNRECRIRGLNATQAAQLLATVNTGRQPSLWMPTLGSWHRLTNSPAATMAGPDVVVTLDSYPDTQLGAIGPAILDNTLRPVFRTYHFGIYNPPIPLMGEPTLQLPKGTCVDLNPGVSLPSGVTTSDYDILFSPSGQLAFTGSTGGAGHVFLWVRDPGKYASMNPLNTTALQQGGEMMIVAIKAKSGSIGAAPVNWPDAAVSTSPYYFAQKAVAGP